MYDFVFLLVNREIERHGLFQTGLYILVGFLSLQRGLLSSQDFVDAQKSVRLAMTGLTGVCLSAALLVDDNFFGLLVLFNGGQDFRAGDHRLSNNSVISASDHHDLVEEDGSLNGDVNFADHNLIALSDFELYNSNKKSVWGSLRLD